MVTAGREDYYNRLKLVRQHGLSVNDRVRHASDKVIFEDNIEVGYNYRMTDIQADVGISQLAKLDWIEEVRRKIADKYYAAFAGIECVEMMYEPEDYHINQQSFPLYLKPNSSINCNNLIQTLLDNGIATRSGIMISYRETACKTMPGYANLSMPISEDVADNSMIIPLFYQWMMPMYKR